MVLEREALEDMTVKQLLALSYEVGSVIDNPLAGKETIISQLLIDSAKEPVPAPKEAPTAAIEGKPATVTIEQLKDALNPYCLRGMKLFYNQSDATWLIRVRMKNIRIRDSLTGEERFVERWKDDSGTMHQPLEVIKRCARVLMSGVPTAKEVEVDPSMLMKDYEAVA